MKSFNTEPLMKNVQKVIQDGLNEILSEYSKRYELLEETHRQIMRLPSVVKEIEYINDTPSVTSSVDDETEDKSMFVSVKNMTHNLIREEIYDFEDRLNKLEKNYENIIPILDKILTKMTSFSQEIKEIKLDKTDICFTSENFEKSSVVKTSENENVEIHIEETNDNENSEVENSDDEERDINSDMITSSEISLQRKVEDNSEFEQTHLENVESESKNTYLEVQEELQEVEVVEEEVQEEEEEKEVVEEEEEVVEKEVEEEEVVEEEELQEEEEVVEEVQKEVEELQDELQEEEAEEAKEAEKAEEVEEAEVVEELVVEEEEASIETETREESEKEEEQEEQEQEEEEEEIFEIEIDDKTYCTNDDKNGFIWELTEDGEQGEKIGYFKDEEPFFYADEN